MKPILKAKGLTKHFYTPHTLEVLRGVDLTVNPGDSIAIMGRSGEGKSTLLQILGTLETPTSGFLSIMDKPAHSHTNQIRNQHIGFVFQAFHLLEDYTALENVMMPAWIARQNPSSTREKALDLLNKVGLSERRNHFAKQLSGGEKQRVSIARAFLNEPDIIMADEPSGNLDKTTAAEIHTLLLDYAHNQGKALVLVTHDPELASLCKFRYMLQNGSMEQIV